jgi:oligoribonuclease NrnB/cAMP/cGMP phosphodiesterase (DHH superfamily)
LQPAEDFKRLYSITKNIVWIDHHKSAILDNPEMNMLAGTRSIVDGSACELTWKYYFANKPMPELVKLISDYDTWTFKYGDVTKNVHMGLISRGYKPDDDALLALIDPANAIATLYLEVDGQSINRYITTRNKDNVKNAFEVELDGRKGIACNAFKTSALLFDSLRPELYEKYEFTSVFIWNGKHWSVSLYTEREDIDVSLIASKYGGGGHRKAAGFECKELPFTNKGEINVS